MAQMKKMLPKEILQKILNSLEQTVILLDSNADVIYTNHEIPEDILDGSARAVVEKAKKIYNGTKLLTVEEIQKIDSYTAIIGRLSTDYTKEFEHVQKQEREIGQRLTVLMQKLAVQ